MKPPDQGHPDDGDERFVLDASVVSVINNRAFRAELSNGHGFVAFYAARGLNPVPEEIRTGSRIRAEFSPCDMSKARIVESVKSEGGS
ncbi:MAG: hypothetical protein U1E27_12765 [Kiritimatiellia bacterium]|nr:hypothetical protein [Kiritimatiellia bacterium]